MLQLRTDTEDRWSNGTIIEEHDMISNFGNSSYIANINNLKPGVYEVRLIAMNIIGAAEPVLLGTTLTIPSTGNVYKCILAIVIAKFVSVLHSFKMRLVYLLGFFCSSVQFYLLLSPYLCFISLLYLDLYVLGDGALIS